ncbi:MAG TPA: DNA polymerase III subunit delta, partial [Pseudohaliea sp.]|nr:DNA polymerase III subunit delta [Pseudohaliea sp.]
MRINPEQLPAHLAQSVLPVYLVSGDEPLLVQECADRLRAAARAGGCSERQVLDADGRDFDWQALRDCAANLSLFAEHKLVELRLPGGKPGTEGSKALCEYLERADPGDRLLIIAGKLDKSATGSKWYKAIDRAGGTVQVWPVRPRELPGWLERRIRDAGMRIDRDALALLAERVEGNLLAALQEIEKLKLLGTDHVTLASVTDSVLDNARYNLFATIDAALAGDTVHALRMLQGLRGEGVEPAVACWATSREVRLLEELVRDVAGGRQPQQALAAHRVWKSRLGILQAALHRHDPATAT